MPASYHFWGIIFIVFVSFPSNVQAWRWGRWHLDLNLQLAMEYDDNLRRITISKPTSFTKIRDWGEPSSQEIPSVVSPLTINQDGVHKWSGTLKAFYHSRHHIFQGWYGLGIKKFFWYDIENTINNKGYLRYYWRAFSRFLVGGEVRGGDRRRKNEEREYSYFSGYLHLLWLAPKHFRVAFEFNYGNFLYRNKENFPDAHWQGISDGQRYSHDGDRYLINITKLFNRIWKANFAYSFARQFYQFRLDKINDEFKSSLESRMDFLHSFFVRVRFLHRVLLQTSYQFEYLSSDSIGESYLAHHIHLLFSTSLFYSIFFALETRLQLRHYLNGLSFNQDRFSIRGILSEDENIASNLILRLSRPLNKHLILQLRYSLYLNLFGDIKYTRNLFSINLLIHY